MTKYLVKNGLNYGPDDKRAEIGDIVDDIPAKQAERAERDGYIERVEGSNARTPAKKAAATKAAKAEAAEIVDEHKNEVRSQKAEAKERQEPAPKKKGGR